MNRPRSFNAAILCSLLAIAAACLSAAEPVIKHRLMFFEYGKGPNRLVELDADGKVVWEHVPPSIAVLFEVLPNGNVLYAYGGKPTGAREVTRKGEVVHVTPLHTNQEHFHLQTRNIHQLANGNILAAHEGEGAVREVDQSGKVVWEYTGVENAGDAQRLPNGNTLISCGTQKRVIEVTPDKQIAWQFTAADAPELNITWVSSIQPLQNGNFLVGNFLRNQEGKGAHAFEVTRDKKIVWKWDDHSVVKSITTVRAVDE